MNSVMELELLNSKSLDLEIDKIKDVFSNVVKDIIENASDYAIKAMPVNDNVKDVLIDVRKAFHTKDFKYIVKTAVNSSIREGLEILNIPKNVLRDITKVKDIAFKGGLSGALSAGIDILTNKYMKNNIFSPIINRFLKSIKEFLFSKAFKDKIDKGINNIFERIDKYKSTCKQWYQAYESFDIVKMNEIAKKLKYNLKRTNIDQECVNENNVIQNMTALINAKKEKLSQMQLQICNNL